MTLVQADRKAVLTVENGGPPIPAEVLPHLFERFYRADGSRTQGGFGLGLGQRLHRGDFAAGHRHVGPTGGTACAVVHGAAPDDEIKHGISFF